MDDSKDFGTPSVNSEKLVTLNIDGVDVTVPEGTSLMRAASVAGVSVPKLCATDSLEPFGSCRLCLVEIEGKRLPCILYHTSCRRISSFYTITQVS